MCCQIECPIKLLTQPLSVSFTTGLHFTSAVLAHQAQLQHHSSLIPVLAQLSVKQQFFSLMPLTAIYVNLHVLLHTSSASTPASISASKSTSMSNSSSTLNFNSKDWRVVELHIDVNHRAAWLRLWSTLWLTHLWQYKFGSPEMGVQVAECVVGTFVYGGCCWKG